MSDLKDKAEDVVDSAVDAVKDVAGGAVDLVKGVLGGAGDAVGGAAGAVGDVAGGAVDAAKNVVGGAADVVGDVAGGAVDAAKNVVGGAADVVGDVAGGAVDAVKNIGGAGAAVIGGVGAAALGGVGSIASGAGDTAGGILGFIKRFWWLALVALLVTLFFRWCAGQDLPKMPAAPAVAVPAAPAMPAAPAAPAVASAGATLLKVQFANGSAAIPATANAELDAFAADLKKTGKKGEVSGHTDNKGNAAGNLKLSEARAKAVAAYLVKAGVAADAVTAKGYGDAKPVGDNATDAGRATNRRVEFMPK